MRVLPGDWHPSCEHDATMTRSATPPGPENMKTPEPRPGAEPGGRILVVDDNPDNLDIVCTRLEFLDYDVRTAERGDRALEMVYDDAPELILLDVMLPGIDGYEVARRIKNDDDLPFIPIILVTARDSTQDKVTGLDAGAEDYLTKPINFPELEARVRSMLRIKRLQDQLEESNRQLEQLSIRDGLTGLFNHRHVHEVLHKEFERSRRSEEPIAVAMFDLDHFKKVNDTYGHQSGDRVLKDLAEILRETAREIDALGRYGGEEFIAVLPETDLEEAAVFAERVRESVEGFRFDVQEDQQITMTISAGVAKFPGEGVEQPEELIDHADRALYAAKAAGRNSVVRHTELDELAETGARPA